MTNGKQRERLVELVEQADQKVQEYILENDHMDWIPKPKELAEVRADYLLTNGVIVSPCKVGDTVYKIRKFCEKNTGYKEFYRPSKEFEKDCPYLDPQSWSDDCDRCKVVEDYDEGSYCTLNVKIFCNTCKERLAIQKDKFTLSMLHSVYNTPMFNENTSLEDTYFLTEKDAENALGGVRG